MATIVLLGAAAGVAQEGTTCALRLTVTSELPFPRVPLDPSIDFKSLIEQAGVRGVLDPNSIAVVNATTGDAVPFALTEDFAYGDHGRLEWVVVNPKHTTYEIRFKIVSRRAAVEPAKAVPLVGTGDLLRDNAGTPRPIVLPYLSRLVDLTGDGKADLVGCWNYAYRPGWPWDGIVCYPRVGNGEQLDFGDLLRVRFVVEQRCHGVPALYIDLYERGSGRPQRRRSHRRDFLAQPRRSASSVP